MDPTVDGASQGSPLRVLQIVEATCTGVGRHALDLCSGLAKRGHEVHLIYSGKRIDRQFSRSLAELQEYPTATTTCFDIERSIGIHDYRAVRFVKRYLKEQASFDVVHGHSSKGGAIARLSAMGTGVPSVYTPNAIRTMNPLTSSLSRRLVGLIERGLSKVQGKIIAVSPEEQSHLIELGIPPSKVVVVANGIEPEELPSPLQAREALDLPLESPVMGFIGRFSDQKAVNVLIDALPDVLRSVEEARLAIIGTGELESELRQQAQSLDVEHAIHWLGEQPGYESMPAFDIFVLPSRYEGMPYVLIESLMAGIPAITTDKASAGELIKNNENGMIVPAESPAELAQAIVKLLSDKELRQQFAQKTLRRSAAFTLDVMVEATLDLYHDLCACQAS